MKKLVKLSVALLACVMLLTSCNKEGKYNPKQKISQIVDSYSYTSALGITHSASIKQVWNWADDHLSYIEYYDANGNKDDIWAFHYDDKDRVDEMNNGYNMFKFEYDGNQLDKVELYNSDGLAEIYTFERDGKTVVKILRSIMDNKSDMIITLNPFAFFLPENAANLVVAKAPANTKGVMTYELIWDGKNVTRIDAAYEGESTSFFWKYDDNVNPFKGLLDRANNFFETIYSENNVIEEISAESGTTTFQYVYDGKYPVKKSWVENSEIGSLGVIPVNRVREFTY